MAKHKINRIFVLHSISKKLALTSKKNALKTPITYYGGKQNMLKHILPIIPPHTAYIEPFFGGGAVFFAKEKSKIEVINDLNSSAICFYEQAKTNFPKLQQLVRATPHSRAVYRKAMVVYDNPSMFNKLRRAWAFWVLTNQGWGSKIGSWGYGIKDNKSEL